MLSLLTVSTMVALAADPNTPHPHQGVLQPFDGKPPAVQLDEDMLAKLAKNKPVLVQSRKGDGGRGMAIQDVRAPTSAVWAQIADFQGYVGKVDHVTVCEPYKASGTDQRVRFNLKAMGSTYEYYIQHDFRPDEGFVTWTLDYSRESDLDDSVGYWYVVQHPENAEWSRLYYSVEVKLKGWVPGFIQDIIAKKGLVQATEWVKRESEAAHES